MDKRLEVIRLFCERFSNSTQNSGQLTYLETGVECSFPPGIKLSGELMDFYSHVEMSGSPTIGGDMFLQIFEPRQIGAAQMGWKWIDRALTPNPNWKDEWIIFADRNGDVLFAESSDAIPNRIWGSVQQTNFVISDSFSDFLKAIIICMDIEEFNFSNDTRNDDMSYKEEVLQAMKSEVGKKVHGIHMDGFMKYFFG